MTPKVNWDTYAKEHGTTAFPEDLLHKYEGYAVLDIGCGVGDHLSSLKKAKIRVGIELSFERLKKGRAQKKGIIFVQADATKLPFKDKSFDTVISVDVIEHIPNYKAFVSEAYRVLKPGGVALIQTPNYPVKRVYDLVNWLNPRGWRASFADDPTHCSKFTFPKFRSVLREKFSSVELRSRNILLENRLPFLRRLNTTLVGKVLGQKLIAICRK